MVSTPHPVVPPLVPLCTLFVGTCFTAIVILLAGISPLATRNKADVTPRASGDQRRLFESLPGADGLRPRPGPTRPGATPSASFIPPDLVASGHGGPDRCRGRGRCRYRPVERAPKFSTLKGRVDALELAWVAAPRAVRFDGRVPRGRRAKFCGPRGRPRRRRQQTGGSPGRRRDRRRTAAAQLPIRRRTSG